MLLYLRNSRLKQTQGQSYQTEADGTSVCFRLIRRKQTGAHQTEADGTSVCFRLIRRIFSVCFSLIRRNFSRCQSGSFFGLIVVQSAYITLPFVIVGGCAAVPGAACASSRRPTGHRGAGNGCCREAGPDHCTGMFKMSQKIPTSWGY